MIIEKLHIHLQLFIHLHTTQIQIDINHSENFSETTKTSTWEKTKLHCFYFTLIMHSTN